MSVTELKFVAEPQRSTQVADILLLEQKIREATTLADLGYILVNDTRRLSSFTTATLWVGHHGRNRVVSVSGIPAPVNTAPYTNWIDRVCKSLCRAGHTRIQTLTAADLDAELAAEWVEFLPAHALWLPLVSPAQGVIGGLLLAREEPWQTPETTLLQYWAGAASQALETLQLRRRPWYSRFSMHRPGIWLSLAAMLLLMLFIPVRLSVMAPGEVVPGDPIVLRAPLEGVIETVHVEPNQEVTSGQMLVNLDDTRLLARLDVARQELEIARAEYRKAEQSAVTDRNASSDIPMLRARIQQREAEVSYVESLLARIQIRAPQDGVIVFPGRQELDGKPIRMGERIMTLADPASAEIDVWVPVSDSLPLSAASPVNLFLNVRPGKPYTGELVYLNYQAELSPEGILAFRGRAVFTDPVDLPRIGWRGVARVYGESVPLYYLLFRRPYSFARQWLGL